MRRGPSKPGALVGALALVVMVVSRTSAAAVLPVWTITPTAFTAYAGQAKTVTFTATNLTLPVVINPTLIGCVRVNVPNSVDLDAAAIVSPASGWTANMMGGGVDIRATSSGARLDYLEAVRFSVTMTPNSVGAFLFSAFAFEQQNCSTPLGGSQNIAATILPPLLPTPTPVPTASPVPTATPAPTANPTATPIPSATPAQTPGPGATATPTPTPPPGGIGPGAGSPSPTPSPSPTGSPGGPSPSSEVVAPTGSPTGLAVGSNDGHGDASGISIDIGAGTPMDGIEWSVPAVTLGAPGIALILWVAFQAGSGIIWLPWVRRLRRTKRRPRAVSQA